jgi:hypothetical protein
MWKIVDNNSCSRHVFKNPVLSMLKIDFLGVVICLEAHVKEKACSYPCLQACLFFWLNGCAYVFALRARGTHNRFVDSHASYAQTRIAAVLSRNVLAAHADEEQHQKVIF